VPGLLSAPIGQLGAGALVTLVVLLILSGRLVTRRQLQDTQADRDYWRTAHDTQQQITLKQGMSMERLLVLSETSAHALQEIQAAVSDRGESR
jgi:hypothetical protein